MKYSSRKEFLLGLALGLLFPLMGFTAYGLFWARRFNKSFEYFAVDLFWTIPGFKSSILALSLLANLIPFLWLVRKDRYQAGRGVLAAVFLFVPFVIYFRFS